MKNVMFWIMCITIIGAVLYLPMKCTRKLSYEWFYKDMVQETVKEMVKPQTLK